MSGLRTEELTDDQKRENRLRWVIEYEWKPFEEQWRQIGFAETVRDLMCKLASGETDASYALAGIIASTLYRVKALEKNAPLFGGIFGGLFR